MLEENRELQIEIFALLDHYEEGRNILKRPNSEWEPPITIKPGFEGKDLPQTWLDLVEEVCGMIARKKYGIETYKNQLQLIDSAEMLDMYSSIGLPNMYRHWSFGKHRARDEGLYSHGMQSLAYEIVINSDPTRVYCMDGNTTMMQILVIAHAGYGHNCFFKNNYLFKDNTDAYEIFTDTKKLNDSVRKYIEKHGQEAVEQFLDSCHALKSHAVDRAQKPPKPTQAQIEARRKRLEWEREQSVNVVMDSTMPGQTAAAFRKAQVLAQGKDRRSFAGEENLLTFCADWAPFLEPWQRDLARQVAGQAQYFYPQRQTQVMNEGCATSVHYWIMNDLSDMDLISPGMMLEFLHSHTSVVFQPEYDDKRYSGINPYALGFAMMQDIRRVCENPTEQDREWFKGKNIIERPWLDVMKEAWANYRDESFIMQFLSPTVIERFKFFRVLDDPDAPELKVSAIHNERGYKEIRRSLAAKYDLGEREPEILTDDYDFRGTRILTLKHTMHNGIPLDPGMTPEVVKHLQRLWTAPVVLNSVDENDKVIKTYASPEGTKQPLLPQLEVA